MILQLLYWDSREGVGGGSYESWSSHPTYWSTDKWSYIYRWDIDNIKVHSPKNPDILKEIKLKGYSNK